MLNLLLFVFSYLAGFILAVSNSPVWAFMLYQVVYFMSPLERWWSDILPKIGYSFLTVVLMAFVLFKNHKMLSLNRLMAVPQFKWVYLIAVAYICTIPYAALPQQNLEAVMNFVKLAIIISIAYKLIDTDRALDGVLSAYIAGAAYIGFMAFQTGRNSGDRVEGIGTVDAVDSNGIAAAIAPAIILCIAGMWASRNKSGKFAYAFAGAFIANGIVLINSRGSFLATLAGLLYFIAYLLFSKHQRQHQRRSAFALIVFGLIAAAFLVDESALQRFHSMGEEKMTAEEQTGATRLFFWRAAIDMSLDHPFGAGAMGFEAYSPDYIPEGIDTGFSRNRAVHSTWFEALTDVGFLGLFFLLMLLKACYWATRQCKRVLSDHGEVDKFYKVVAIEAAFLSFIVAMTFLNRTRAEVLYWMVLFTAVAYNIYVLKDGAMPKSIRPDVLPRYRRQKRSGSKLPITG